MGLEHDREVGSEVTDASAATEPATAPASAADRVLAWLPRMGALALLAGGIWLAALSIRPAEVTLHWETGSEDNVAGFQIWRAEGEGELAALEGETIPARGSAQSGAAYEYVDRAVEAGRRYSYQIEEISPAGDGQRLPDRVEVVASGGGLLYAILGVAASLLGFVMLRRERSRVRSLPEGRGSLKDVDARAERDDDRG